MADPVKFRIEIGGIEELESKLQALEKKMEDLLFEATAEGAAVVTREAKINSQRGGDSFPNRITGNLMRSIKPIKTVKTPLRSEFKVGSAMIYALRLEYGFSDTDKRGRKYHQPARPYLRPALDEHKNEINEAFRERIRKALGGSL